MMTPLSAHAQVTKGASMSLVDDIAGYYSERPWITLARLVDERLTALEDRVTALSGDTDDDGEEAAP
jgi:hypothetical protein